MTSSQRTKVQGIPRVYVQYGKAAIARMEYLGIDWRGMLKNAQQGLQEELEEEIRIAESNRAPRASKEARICTEDSL